jgi:hypothetical protein
MPERCGKCIHKCVKTEYECLICKDFQIRDEFKRKTNEFTNPTVKTVVYRKTNCKKVFEYIQSR